MQQPIDNAAIAKELVTFISKIIWLFNFSNSHIDGVHGAMLTNSFLTLLEDVNHLRIECERREEPAPNADAGEQAPKARPLVKSNLVGGNHLGRAAHSLELVESARKRLQSLTTLMDANKDTMDKVFSEFSLMGSMLLDAQAAMEEARRALLGVQP